MIQRIVTSGAKAAILNSAEIGAAEAAPFQSDLLQQRTSG
jgi:hypothetical protein